MGPHFQLYTYPIKAAPSIRHMLCITHYPDCYFLPPPTLRNPPIQQTLIHSVEQYCTVSGFWEARERCGDRLEFVVKGNSQQK